MLIITSERAFDIDEELHTCFTDREKTFDRVNRTESMQILEGIRNDWRERRLNMDQRVKV
jgi:hypothetical protein